ncbi:MAG: helix-turn-helix transcriptional regulator [Eggerthellaceae bacterium]|jgi:transcriptional regulator with XRE-family HTH domain|nr:helix-turn-helix transcriptional regulator [Eggerthellaceae bacterium]
MTKTSDSVEERCRRLGQNIRQRRMEEKISQARLALMVGSAQSYMYRIEAGRVHVGIFLIYRIAEALDCTPRDLIDF